MNNNYLQNTLIYTPSISLQNNSEIQQSDLHYSTNYQELLDQTNIPAKTYSKLSTYPKISYSTEITIPLSIITKNSSLEAIVFYLKKSLGLSYVEISRLLNRDQRTIWVTYSNAVKKGLNVVLENPAKIFIPVDILSSRRLSILESIVIYLRETYALSFIQVSDLLGKNYRTIWTVYRRAMKKLVISRIVEGAKLVNDK